MRRFGAKRLHSFAAYLISFWCCISAAYAGQHRIYSCAALPLTFSLCRDGTSCGANDNNDAITIENVPVGGSVTFVTGNPGGNLPVQVHYFGQGQTQLSTGDTHYVYSTSSDSLTFTASNTGGKTVVDVKAEIENNNQPPPQTIDITLSCSPPAATGSIQLIKQTTNGDGTFTFNVSPTVSSSPSITTTNGTGTTTITNLTAGTTYTITENSLAGWTPTGAGCGSITAGASNVQVTVVANQTISCTFTNTKQVTSTGFITITKATIGGDDTFDFTGAPNGAFQIQTSNNVGQTTFQVTAGTTYTIVESSKTGWSATGLTCSSGGTPQGTTTAVITVGASQTVECTFTNTRSGAGSTSITIVKAAIGRNGTFSFSGTLGNFNLTTANGAADQTFSNLTAGVYTVTENVPSGWTLSSLSCSGTTTVNGATATITLAAGQNITCTYTNTSQQQTTSSITIVKAAIGGNGIFSFIGSGALGNFQITTTNGSGERSFSNLSAGTYTISETGQPGWTLTSLSCSGSTAVNGGTATINLGQAQNITCTYTNTVGSAVSTAALTIIKQTNGRDGTFAFTSNLPGQQSFSLTTQTGFAELQFANIASGTYSITEGTLSAGWSLTALTCTGGSTSVNVGTRTASIVISTGASIKCTFTNSFNEHFIRERTSETIRNFMNRRADLLTSEEPDRNRFIRRLSGSVWGASGSGLPFTFTGSTDQNFERMAFASSLSQIASSMTSKNAKFKPKWNQDIDIWAEAHYNYYTVRGSSSDLNRNGNFGVAYVGADYLLTPKLLVGALVQFDTLTDKIDSSGIGANGNGWMAGPYFSTRVFESLFFDGRAGWGKSANTVNPFGSYSDQFDTTRSLYRANLTGNWTDGQFRVTPSAGVTYYQETQRSYTDSLGVFIPSQTVNLGRANFGPEIAYRFFQADGTMIEPHVSITGFYDFKKDAVQTVQGVPVGVQNIRGKVEAGFLVGREGGYTARFSASYDGIGDSSLNVYGGQIWLNAALNPEVTSQPKQRAPFTWAGFYVGGQLGYANVNYRQNFVFGGQDEPGALGGTDNHSNSPVLGMFGGYNHLFGRYLLGVEADIKWATKSATEWGAIFLVPEESDDGFQARSRMPLYGSLRTRLGYAWKRSLLYMTGGLAIGRILTDVTPIDFDNDMPTSIYSNKVTRLGWTIGTGVEHAFSDRFTGRLEFRYSDFGSVSFDLTDPLLLPDYGPNTVRQSVTKTELSAGIAYKF